MDPEPDFEPGKPDIDPLHQELDDAGLLGWQKLIRKWIQAADVRFIPRNRTSFQGRLFFRPSSCKVLIYRTCCRPPLGTILFNHLVTDDSRTVLS